MHTSTNVTYTLLRRKPSKWAVEFGDKLGTVERTGIADHGVRWKLIIDGAPGGFFASRRSAFHFFKTGERFLTKPVYAVVKGRKTQKRVR